MRFSAALVATAAAMFLVPFPAFANPTQQDGYEVIFGGYLDGVYADISLDTASPYSTECLLADSVATDVPNSQQIEAGDAVCGSSFSLDFNCVSPGGNGRYDEIWTGGNNYTCTRHGAVTYGSGVGFKLMRTASNSTMYAYIAGVQEEHTTGLQRVDTIGYAWEEGTAATAPPCNNSWSFYALYSQFQVYGIGQGGWQSATPYAVTYDQPSTCITRTNIVANSFDLYHNAP